MLIKVLVYVLLTATGSSIFAQDTLWNELKIDENLRISLPGQIDKMDTLVEQKGQKMRLKVFSCKIQNNDILLTVTPEATNINVDNSESFNDALKDIKKGISNGIKKKGFKCSFKDTSIDNLPSVKALVYEKTATDPRMFYYLFLVNDKIYSIAYTLPPDNLDFLEKKHLQRLLNSIHFDKTAIKEQQFKTKAESRGYKAGEAIGYLLGLGLFVGAIAAVIIFVNKRKR